jgi:hypothetical protein
MSTALFTKFQTSAQRQANLTDSRPTMDDLCALLKNWKNELEELGVRTPYYLEDWTNKRVFLTAKISAPPSQPIRTLHLEGWESGQNGGSSLRIASRVDGIQEKEAFVPWRARDAELIDFAKKWLLEHGGNYTREKLLAGPKAP